MFGGRLAPLRTAAILAVGFVVLRVGYRVLFAGASGGGAVLLDLPRVPLGGPFAHITLFGPVTAGGLAAAALSALPVAAVILAFGVLNAIVDVRRMFARGAARGPLRTVSRALVIAWATFPALLESVRRVRTARDLRGERSLPALLVPVFEHTVERALALAASMEVRGFAAGNSSRRGGERTRRDPRPEPVCERPVVLAGAALGFDGLRILDDLDFALDPGTLTLVAGATGSGKSSLLHAMSGLFQHFLEGEQFGVIEIAGVDRRATPPRDTAGFVGVVAQDVRLSFVAETVAEELGFALATRGVAPVIVRDRAEEIAARLGIRHLLDRSVHALSAGEACLVAVGAALISRPVVLLVDEPLADLDAEARSRVVDVLDRLAHEAGVCVVVAEHATQEWEAAADARLQLEDGTVRRIERGAITPPDARPGTTSRSRSLAARSAAARTGLPARRSAAGGAALHGAAAGAPLASIRNVSVSHGDLPAVEDASLELAGGELVALRGPNGAGKSSLLLAIALPTSPGTVTIDGHDLAGLKRAARRDAVTLVPERFDDLLFATTVAEECRRADRSARRARTGARTGRVGRAGQRATRAGRQGGHAARTAGTAEVFASLLGFATAADARHLLRRHPRDLSAGERLCLVMAVQLATEPHVLLVDEPTRGLDTSARELVGCALLRAAASGAAVVFATHDHDFAERFATRTVHMADGRITAPAQSVVS